MNNRTGRIAVSDAVSAETVRFVGQLTRMLHQEARLTDKLVGAFRYYHRYALGPIVGVGLVFVVDLHVFDDEAVFQYHIEACLDVVRVHLIFVEVIIFNRREWYNGDWLLVEFINHIIDEFLVVNQPVDIVVYETIEVFVGQFIEVDIVKFLAGSISFEIIDIAEFEVNVEHFLVDFFHNFFSDLLWFLSHCTFLHEPGPWGEVHKAPHYNRATGPSGASSRVMCIM